MFLEIDSRLRVVVVKPLKDARVLDPMQVDKEFHKRDKQEQMENYEKRKDMLIQDEIKRLKRNKKVMDGGW